MLKKLEILNGTLDLKFNEYIYEYTITVNNDVNTLELSYELDDNCNINIRGNNIVEGENIVYLDVFNLDTTITYTLYVYKEKSETVSGIEHYINSLEVNNVKEISLYKLQLLSISIFLLIIILFAIIFKKSKKLTKK